MTNTTADLLSNLRSLFATTNQPAECLKCIQSLQHNFLAARLTVHTALSKAADLAILAETYEIGALCAMQLPDLAQFDFFTSQALAIYLEAGHYTAHSSLILGLHLMRLLTQSQIAAFHLLLERVAGTNWNNIDAAQAIVQQQDAFIAFPVHLEQALMEGAFQKVLNAVQNVPSPYFAVFSGVVAEAVREAIAGALEVSYGGLQRQHLAQLLFLKEEEVERVASQRAGWKVEGKRILFVQPEQEEEAVRFEQTVIERHLGIAKELEAIL